MDALADKELMTDEGISGKMVTDGISDDDGREGAVMEALDERLSAVDKELAKTTPDCGSSELAVELIGGIRLDETTDDAGIGDDGGAGEEWRIGCSDLHL